MNCFADDPLTYAVDESVYVHHLPREQQEALQIEALRQRFAAMRDALPPLAALADAAKIDRIDRLEDAAPLLFPHSLYKSYPDYLLGNMHFAELTEWLSRLTLVDLSAVKNRSFGAIDHWMDALDDETDLAILTTSGTTEALSLLPRGKLEGRLLADRLIVAWHEPDQALPFHISDPDCSMLWMSYADGRSGMLRSVALLREKFAEFFAQFIALMPGRMSTDLQYHMSRLEAAQKRGAVPPPHTPYIQARQEEVAQMHGAAGERMQTVLEIVRDELAGSPVHMVGGVILLHRFAEEGLKMGMEPAFGPRSVVGTGGGTKGVVPPPDMESTIKRFAGVDVIYEAYGMSEIADAFAACREGRFHILPWTVPFVFAERTGALLPRRGTQTGRAAFFDLTAQTSWGGVVTADRVAISWDRCRCGRTTPQVLPPIARIAATTDGDHSGGGPTPEAIHAALMALNRGI